MQSFKKKRKRKEKSYSDIVVNVQPDVETVISVVSKITVKRDSSDFYNTPTLI